MYTDNANRKVFAAAAILALAAALATCPPARAAQDEGEGDGDGGRREAGPPDGDARNGVLVALKHEIGAPDYYKCSYSRTQDGTDKYEEKGTFALKFETLGRTPEGYALVTMLQQPLQIDRREYVATKKKWIDKIVPHNIETVILGPNYKQVTNRRCYVFTPQNFVAQMRGEDVVTKTDGNIVRGTITDQNEHTVTIESLAEKVVLPRARVQKIETTPSPHVLRKETPHYLFPVFSRHPVTAGQAWQYHVPVIIPMSSPSTGRLLPSHFDALTKAQLREVRTEGGAQVAFVDYTYEGAFDSAGEEFRNRFSPEIHAAVRVVHKIGGKGWISVDVTNGRILQKSENMSLTMEQRANQQTNTITITAAFQMQWIPPDRVKDLNAQAVQKDNDR